MSHKYNSSASVAIHLVTQQLLQVTDEGGGVVRVDNEGMGDGMRRGY
jgi:hypothetical protein